MKFKKHSVILSEFVNWYEVLGDFRNTEDICKGKWTSNNINRTMTDMRNVQTCSIADLNLLLAIVPLLYGQSIQITCDVVGCPCISIPIGVNLVGCICHNNWCRVCFIYLIWMIETMITFYCRVPNLATHLTSWLRTTTTLMTSTIEVTTTALATASPSLIGIGVGGIVSTTLWTIDKIGRETKTTKL